jgi:uncharacterized protein YdaU (DUF1376 family)
MAEKPPYFPMYPKDIVGDDLVRVMTTTEFGAYVMLLCAAWVATPACTVPDDDTELARLAGMNKPQWKRAKRHVMRPWKRRKDGRWVQPRLLKEFRKFLKLKKTRGEAGKLGGLSKAARRKPLTPSKAVAKPYHARMTLDVVSSSSPNSEKTFPARACETDSVRDALREINSGVSGNGASTPEPPGGFHFRVNFLDHYPKFSNGRKRVDNAERVWAGFAVEQQAACEVCVIEFAKSAARWPPEDKRFLPSPDKWLEENLEHGFAPRPEDWRRGEAAPKVSEKYQRSDDEYFKQD